MERSARWIIGTLCVLYAVVRSWRLGDSCLWFDEIFSVHAAGHGWVEMLGFVAKDLVHPPLFYAALKVWIGIGGESVFWLRLLPVLFAAAALAPFLHLCRELKIGLPATALSLLFFAVNGSLIKYTQTLRMYSMLMFLSLLSVWLFARYFNRGKSWIWLMIVNVLMVHTHYFGWMVIGAEVLAILLFQRIKIVRISVMAAVAAAAFLPWLFAVWGAASEGSDLGQNIAWQPKPGVREIGALMLDLFEPFYFQASNTEPGAIYLLALPMFLAVASAVVLHLVRAATKEDAALARLLLLFAVFPVAAGLVLSWLLPYSVWGTRHLIVATPMFAILAGVSIARIPERFLRLGAVLSIVAIACVSAFVVLLREKPNYVWCGWDGVAADITAKDQAATIYTFENLAAYHLWFATRDGKAVRVKVASGVDAVANDEAYFLPRGFDRVETVPVQNVYEDEFWLAFRPIRRSDDARLVQSFTQFGYTSCLRNEARYDRNSIFWMKIVKDPGRCTAAP